MCVQRFDDSRNSAIHTTYRISLRSSSMREPRDPLLKVLTFHVLQFRRKAFKGKSLWVYLPCRLPRALRVIDTPDPQGTRLQHVQHGSNR